ncbi:MAG: phosphoribosylamine--glycine ligase [Cyclobacteriaceae bacterium]|nr:MAG: phosphoribosylamine--glycine ligase [Cyclobacteriaceae bacterium]
MNILILGSGGREHAFAWKIKQSPTCGQLFIAPGNAGTGYLGENVPIDPTSFPEIGDFVLRKNIELVVVGPEVPLALGIRDYFESRHDIAHIPLVGPGKQGALLESSKDFAKQFMVKYGIPTAGYATFDQTQVEQGLDFIKTQNTPIVLKADGLAAGKGVVICENQQQAEKEFKEMLLESKFGQASAKVVVEEFLDGVEISVFVITDGNSYKILPSAKDYKRIGDGDTGLNTGGMGAVSPVPFADPAFMKKVEDRIVIPTIEGLKSEAIDYRGFIFLGLINVKGEPMVIEYNVRMGDPETQAVLPRVSSDLVDLLWACGTGNLNNAELTIDTRSACTVVMVSGGYPGSYQKGMVIEGLGTATNNLVFHAGTAYHHGRIVTDGGRVLAVTSFDNEIKAALQSVYDTVKSINWQGSYYRQDIGQDLLRWVNKPLETSTE